MADLNLYEQFVEHHKTQLMSSGVPQQFWPSLHHKLASEIFDAGEALQLLLIEYDEEDEVDETRPVFALSVAHENGIKASDPSAIFLIDHAWTFRMNMARQQLEQHKPLADRLCAITGTDLEDERRVDKLLRRMWRYCHAYTIFSESLTAEECQPIWYVMDEVGSSVNHADEANFRLIPFYYVSAQTTYSLLFPLVDCECGEQVTRDFVEHVAKEAVTERAVLLLPWRSNDFRDESFIQTEPSAEYFTSGHIVESYLPAEEANYKSAIGRNEPLKVYAEYDMLRQYLTAPDFQLVDDESTADVLWLTEHFKNFAELAHNAPNKFVNQFPFEYVITIKDLLSITCRRAAKEHHNHHTLETYPNWLPTTYNLKTEVLQFASYYQHRAAKGLDNNWIVKPWNLARGLDTHVTDDIVQIVRLPATGPKIVQKYIDRPVLFYRADVDTNVKFDVRYVTLVKRVQPLEAYVYRKFFLRFANHAFSLDHFDDYEKHFTVMNYQDEADLHHLKCEEFMQQWRQQQPAHPWARIENDICSMLYEVLKCATQSAPPCGIAPCAQSRALYAADIMLEWHQGESGECSIQPKLLEVNWTPDCKRACDYYPDFFNDIFKLLFLDEPNEECFRLLAANEVTSALSSEIK